MGVYELTWVFQCLFHVVFFFGGGGLCRALWMLLQVFLQGFVNELGLLWVFVGLL